MNVPVPLWLVFVFIALMVAQTYFAKKQAEALRDLFDMYLRERAASDQGER